jgi:DNA-binding transcriptional ArsR family regulator
MSHESTTACPDEYIQSTAQKPKAVGHPVRLKLLCLIERDQDPCVSDLWHCLNQPQPVISQHLSILKQCGIVNAEVQKTRRVYTIADPFIRDLVRTIMSSTEFAPQGTHFYGFEHLGALEERRAE